MPDSTPADEALPGGWRLKSYAELESTNDEALKRIRAGLALNEVILAGRQTAGRGRIGRVWQSTAGNLFMTATVSVPENRPASDLAFVAAVAVADAITDSLPGGGRAEIKWPNDLLIGGEKLGGILIETVPERHAAAIGIGMNVMSAPRDKNFSATCLAAHGVEAKPDAVAKMICGRLSVWLKRWVEQGLPPVMAVWRAAAAGMGGAVTVTLANGEKISGMFADIEDDGRLRLETEGGRLTTVTAGDVFFG